MIILPSSSSCFHGISVEGCISEGEVFGIRTQQFGEDSLFLKAIHVLVDVSIHKTIGQCGVGMNVNVEVQINFLKSNYTDIQCLPGLLDKN